jgi:hypothetical protein
MKFANYERTKILEVPHDPLHPFNKSNLTGSWSTLADTDHLRYDGESPWYEAELEGRDQSVHRGATG